jgi:chlorite dismutase
MTSREDLEFMNPNEIEETQTEFYSDKVKECLDNYQKNEFEQEAWEMLNESVDTMQSVIQKQLDELQLIQDQLKQSSRTNTFAINKIQGVKNNLKKLI